MASAKADGFMPSAFFDISRRHTDAGQNGAGTLPVSRFLPAPWRRRKLLAVPRQRCIPMLLAVF